MKTAYIIAVIVAVSLLGFTVYTTIHTAVDRVSAALVTPAN